MGVTLTLTINPLPLVFPQCDHLARQGYRSFVGLGEQRPSPFKSLTLTQRTKGQYRLTGSPGARGKPNLSLQRLAQVIPKGPLRREIEHLINIAVHKADFAHEWRNRRIAHYDLRLAQGSPAISLPPASRQHVEEALAAIRDVMNRIDLHYRQSTTAYERFLDMGNGDDLLRCLGEALGSEKKGTRRTATAI